MMVVHSDISVLASSVRSTSKKSLYPITHSLIASYPTRSDSGPPKLRERYFSRVCYEADPCLILPVAPWSTRVAAVCLVAAVIGLKGLVGIAKTANPANVCLALRIDVKAAIRPASSVAGAPRPVGVRTDAGQGQEAWSHERLSAASSSLHPRLGSQCAQRQSITVSVI
jgi:hypothetical protein